MAKTGNTNDPIVGYDLVNVAKGFAKLNWIVTSREQEFIKDLRSALLFVEANSPDAQNKSYSNSDSYHEKNIHHNCNISYCIILSKYEALWTNQTGFESVPSNPETFRTRYREFIKSAPAFSTLVIKDAFNIKSVEDWRLMINSERLLYASAKRVFLLSASDTLPSEYKRYINLYYHRLPSSEERLQMIVSTLEETNKKLEKVLKNKFKPTDLKDAALMDKLVRMTAGLTLSEIKSGIFRSVQDIRTNYSLDTNVIKTHHKECLEKVTKIDFLESDIRFSDIGGLENLKQYTLNRHNKANENLPKSGIILVGPPGVAKTTFANALGNELGLPTMTLDFSSIFNRLIGESEKAMRGAIDTFETLEGGILVLDEIDKALGGVQSSNKTDGGTTSRVFEILLKWLSDSKRKIYVIATSNSIEDLPPEFSRAGRWDNIFFIDFPTPDECKVIFEKKCIKFGISDWKKAYEKVNLTNMTGAEIEALVVEYCYSKDWTIAKQMVPMIYNTEGQRMAKLKASIGSKYVSAAKIVNTKSSLSIGPDGNLK